jgi:NRAMP (natural resistance-associated macrophage protein)-like metal ion transporter
MSTLTVKPEAQPPERPPGFKSGKAVSGIHFLANLGPGLITGASDDDPSGIATYSQVGAQFGYGLLWTMLLSYPLMAAIQEICARIGRVTGCGLAANLRKNYPGSVLYFVLIAMTIANVFNLGADIGAMGASLALIVPANVMVLTVIFGVISLLAVLFIPYSTYAKYLKWLTFSLFAYVGVIFFVHIPWPTVLRATLIAQLIACATGKSGCTLPKQVSWFTARCRGFSQRNWNPCRGPVSDSGFMLAMGR